MVLLPWTPPYDWAWMVGFLQARAVAGVERFDEGGYSRSFGVEGHRGLIGPVTGLRTQDHNLHG